MKQKLNENQEIITIEEKLSVEELEKASRRLANLVGDHDNVKAQKADAMKGYSDRLKSLENSMSIVANEVHTCIRKTETLVTKKENRAEGVVEYITEDGTVIKKEQLLLGAGSQLHIEDAVVVEDNTPTKKPDPRDYGFDEVSKTWLVNGGKDAFIEVWGKWIAENSPLSDCICEVVGGACENKNCPNFLPDEVVSEESEEV